MAELNRETQHPAVAPGDCKQMARKYGWRLKRIDPTGSKDLPVNCVFEGDCEFPKGSIDLKQPKD